nr:hypothetical protein [Tanacetum cinerariifolium]
MSHPHSNRNIVSTAVLTRSGLVSLNAARPVSIVVPHTTVKSPRPVKHVVNKAHSPIRRPINHKPTPKNSNFHKKVTTVKGNPHQALKDKGVIDSGCSRHMTGNISYLSDFKEFNGGYVAFGGNSKGGKTTGKGKIKTGKLDFDDVYFVKELKFNLFSVSQMVPRENNMYNVDLKNVVPSRDLTCLFAKATLAESNLWHRRLGHINFKSMNKHVKDKEVLISKGSPVTRTELYMETYKTVSQDIRDQLNAEAEAVQIILTGIDNDIYSIVDACPNDVRCGKQLKGNQHNHNTCIKETLDAGKAGKEIIYAQQYVLLPLWSSGSQDPQNTDVDAAFNVKEHEYEVHVSPSSSDKPNKHDEKAKREAKGKKFSFNSTNRVNAASAPVTVIGPNPTNNTNRFNDASPSDNAVSLTFEIGGKSSFVDPS